MSYIADHLAWQQRVQQEFKAIQQYVPLFDFIPASWSLNRQRSTRDRTQGLTMSS